MYKRSMLHEILKSLCTVKALNFAWDLFREFHILAVHCNKHKIREIKFQQNNVHRNTANIIPIK